MMNLLLLDQASAAAASEPQTIEEQISNAQHWFESAYDWLVRSLPRFVA